MSKMLIVVLIAFVASGSLADVYMHNPRGSNNRLNENSAERKNAQRLFDSQNNNRGGYNFGERLSTKSSNENDHYRMEYYQGGGETGASRLVVEWTNQHGCGGNEKTDPHKQNCNIVIQALCQDDTTSQAPNDDFTMRNGQSTQKQQFQSFDKETITKSSYTAKRGQQVVADRGLHESYDYYADCHIRERNKGLFLADQEIAEDIAVNTRQNPNNDDANRFGYECPEERDYYPYFHPSPFYDIAVLTDDTSRCSYYKDNSFNRNVKHLCLEKWGDNTYKPFSNHNNQAACVAAGGEWTPLYLPRLFDTEKTNKAQCEGVRNGITYVWGKAYEPSVFFNFGQIEDKCIGLYDALECLQAPWTRSNHLGNTRDGVPGNYTWKLPNFNGVTKQCILRIRYNITTDDYDPINTDASSNGDNSPIKNNPLVQTGANDQSLQLAINTQQTGRVFQDRSHVFKLVPRPAEISDLETIHNVNVRGKRGNIVQTFPAVEYDFIPNRLEVKVNDLVHFQWTGSNTHNNGNPGGDGQTGDAGEGKAGSDRHNLCQSAAPDQNFPMPVEHTDMFDDAELVVDRTSQVNVNDISPLELSLRLASSGYYKCVSKGDSGCGSTTDSIEDKSLLSNVLDNASPSFEGVVLRFKKKKTYYYLCTRNNNFTNRSQKGKIVVK